MGNKPKKNRSTNNDKIRVKTCKKPLNMRLLLFVNLMKVLVLNYSYNGVVGSGSGVGAGGEFLTVISRN